MTNYDKQFFDYVNSGAISSARVLLPKLQHELGIHSVLDVGCGLGAWLSIWRELGVQDIAGLDGEYVDRAQLLIEASRFQPHDLSKAFDLSRRFDLVQSLEVAEHLPAANAADFVASLVRHGSLVLFSAAPPGQGGDQHINEQPYDYWKALFEVHGFRALDCVRPLVADNTAVEPWYRYNTVLYAAGDQLDSLPTHWRDCLLGNDESLDDISPLGYRIRKQLVRILPVPVATGVARLKERAVVRARRRGTES
ncbi:MAG: class I SAM-dependent methyltransferase [Gammaproteobacteria bacterium]|nr:class I SAM-dependent methyltransferase [Gammaproteobacteria bacterium]NNF60195.1 methyltransferase domain-containing protein [Gammaproteobacteria bacterium]NNM21608.1 methyltransferase domain-containing protein [Gammaproteobacteria bacterium]